MRVAAPGATIIIVTWCHRDLAPSEESLQPWEKSLLSRICDAYYLPEWCSTADYVKLLKSHSVQVITNSFGRMVITYLNWPKLFLKLDLMGGYLWIHQKLGLGNIYLEYDLCHHS